MIIKTLEEKRNKKKVKKLLNAIMDAACHQPEHPFDFDKNNSFKLFQSYHSSGIEIVKGSKVIPIDSLSSRKSQV